MSTPPAHCTTDFDPGGERLAARRTAALARLAATRGTWHEADTAVAHIIAGRAPEPAPMLRRDRQGPRTRPDENTVWARIGRRDTEREGALRGVYVRHFNGTHVYFTEVDPEPYRGVRAEHLAAYEGGTV